MITYRYSTKELGQTFTRCASVGAALDMALMDLSASQAEPERIERDDFTILDRNDIDIIYARTWKHAITARPQQMRDLLRRIVTNYRTSDEAAGGISSIDYLIEEAETLLKGKDPMRPEEIAQKVVYDHRYSPHSLEWHIAEAIREERK